MMRCSPCRSSLTSSTSGAGCRRTRFAKSKYEHSYAEFVQHLKENQRNPDDQVIITYSLGYLALGGELESVDPEGHASPVAAYNEQSDMVLMLEVDGTKEPFWIKSADIYGAMSTLDPVSGEHRGWARVAREQPPESS